MQVDSILHMKIIETLQSSGLEHFFEHFFPDTVGNFISSQAMKQVLWLSFGATLAADTTMAQLPAPWAKRFWDGFWGWPIWKIPWMIPLNHHKTPLDPIN